MSSKEFFAEEGQAKARQEELEQKGIKSHILVDPMGGIYPSHQEFAGVELIIDDEQEMQKAS
jgi:hypothetical protein